MLPRRLAAVALLRRSRMFFEIEDRAIVVTRETSGSRIELGQIDSEGEPSRESQRAVAAAVRQTSRACVAAIIRLRANQVLRRRVPLPLAAAGSLQQVFAHEFDRQMPLSLDQAYFDCRIISRDGKSKGLVAELIAVRRSIIDPALVLARECGLRGVAVELDDAGGPIRLPGLLRTLREIPGGRREFRLSIGLAAIAVALVAGVVAALVDRQQTYDEALSQQLVVAKAQAQVVQQLQKRVDAAIESQRFLPQQKRSSSVMTVLNEVTRILPDGAWLFDLQTNGREVRLHGFAPEASGLLARFAQSPLFENARFRSPLTQGPQDGLERFDLSLDFKGLP